MKIAKLLQQTALAGVVLLSACKKEAGPQGPAGTANVIYSDWIATSPWTASTTSTGSGKSTFYFDIATAKVTQDILDKGAVLVYAKLTSDPDGAGVKQLPTIYYNLGGAGTEYRFQYTLSLGRIRVICDVLPTGSPSNSNEVRYVIIPGGVASTERTINPAQVTYEDACKAYGIPN